MDMPVEIMEALDASTAIMKDLAESMSWPSLSDQIRRNVALLSRTHEVSGEPDVWEKRRRREERLSVDIDAEVPCGPLGYSAIDAVSGLASRFREHRDDRTAGSVLMITIGRDRIESYAKGLDAAVDILRRTIAREGVAAPVQPEGVGDHQEEPRG